MVSDNQWCSTLQIHDVQTNAVWFMSESTPTLSICLLQSTIKSNNNNNNNNNKFQYIPNPIFPGILPVANIIRPVIPIRVDGKMRALHVCHWGQPARDMHYNICYYKCYNTYWDVCLMTTGSGISLSSAAWALVQCGCELSVFSFKRTEIIPPMSKSSPLPASIFCIY